MRTRGTVIVIVSMLGLGTWIPGLNGVAGAAEPAANTWVRVGDAEIGPRSNHGMVWAPGLKRFVIWGGGIGMYPDRAF